MRFFFPRTRETEEETRQRVWRQYGWVVIKPDVDPMNWTLRDLLKQWATGRWGQRREENKG